MLTRADRRKRTWKDAGLEGEVLALRYTIAERIGRGGMGEVYRARDQLLQRDVAIKVVRPSRDATVMERFRREAFLAARFEHPNVVRVFDLGETADGNAFLVMELLRGKRFAQVLSEEGPVSVARAAELLEGIAAALDLMHSGGVVHRDLKLDNLMLVERDDGGVRPKLLDFGIALAPIEEAPRLTVDGSFVGTPLYAAPELLLSAAADASADIYSLALVAYKLLTGVVPFEELEPQHMLQAKLIEDPPPPSHFRADLSREIDELFSRALARDPAVRPRTASELIRGLCEPAAPGLPVNRFRPRLFAAAGLVAFVLAGTIAWIASGAI